ncbi:MAG: beta-propeller domain-containing protein [Terricaulis sp.]
MCRRAAVDEGDIVKRIGHFLIVLQDGRLFTIDMRVANQPGLAFIDRINVYRDPNTGTWYDEMLVYRNRILVTGFSYQQNAHGDFRVLAERRWPCRARSRILYVVERLLRRRELRDAFGRR